MSKLIYIVIISVLLGVGGNMWWENKKEVDRLNQEFTEYKKRPMRR
ncbi:contig_1.orf00094 [Escherichia phage vB_Eco_TB34]|nr:contig_1.orf00094 [Escherichia phage vB_Eco_TB34]